MKTAFDFATVGFRPHPETGEFVTIGVVILETTARRFDYALLDATKTERVAHMFPEVKPSLYQQARELLEKKFTELKRTVNGAESPKGPDWPGNGGLFAAMTSPREGMFCYPVKGRSLGPDAQTVLADLKNRFVEKRQAD
jgi:hypothetical protein